MSSPKGPVFDQEFFSDVYRRAAHVRELALAELISAEERVLGEDAEVLPLFTEPFWQGIQHRTRRVRTLAVQDLEAAEERLLTGTPAPRAPRWRMSPQAWARAQGFALALLAILALLPQVAPVLSWARIGGTSDEPEVEIGPVATPGSDSQDPSSGSSAPGGGEVDQSGSRDAPSDPAEPETDTLPVGEDGSAGATSVFDESTAAGSPGQSGASATGAAGVGALRAPDDVTVRVAGPTSLEVSWTDRSADEVGFEIQRETGTSAEEDSRSVAQNESSFVWTNLEPGSTECFRVRAVGGAEPSDWEPDTDRGYACASVPAPPPPSPNPSPSPEPSPTVSPSPGAEQATEAPAS